MGRGWQPRCTASTPLAWDPRFGLRSAVAKKRSHPAVKFLWVVAGLTVLFLAGAIAYRLFEKDLMRWAMVPTVAFKAVPMPSGADYRQARMWIARPDIA